MTKEDKEFEWLFLLVPMVLFSVFVLLIVLSAIDAINLNPYSETNKEIMTLNGTSSLNISNLEKRVLTDEEIEIMNRYVDVINNEEDPLTLQYPYLSLNRTGNFSNYLFQIVADPKIFDWTLHLDPPLTTPSTVYDNELDTNITTNYNSPGQYYTNNLGIDDTVAFIYIQGRYYKLKNVSKVFVTGSKGTFHPYKIHIRFNPACIMSLNNHPFSPCQSLLMTYNPHVIITKDLTFTNYSLHKLSSIPINDTSAIAAIPTTSDSISNNIEEKKSVYTSLRVEENDWIIVPPYKHPELYLKYAYYLGSNRLQNLIYTSPTANFDMSFGTYLIIRSTQDQYFEMGPVQ